jgi:hypothetical protein
MRHVTLAILMAFTLAPLPGSPQSEPDGDDGPGTEWRECRADAHYDMAMCYHERKEIRFGYMICNLAWELDLLGCDAVLLEGICPFNWCEKET